MARFRRTPEQRRADEERLQRAIEKSKAALAEWRRQLEREATGEARGFRYAIECGSLWIDGDGKHKRGPTIFEGDRDSSQARASQHRDKNRLGGGIHHTPTIYPEAMVAHRVALHERWEQKR
jgi:hypothetical protein